MKNLMIVSVTLFALVIFLGGCENSRFGSKGDRLSCTVTQVTGGSLITCPDGSIETVSNGQTGSIGATGTAGQDGTNGIDGSNGTNGSNGANGVNGTNGTNGSNGHNALVSSTLADASLCPAGGYVITTGTDANDDSILELNEVTDTAVLCNGTNGSNGSNGLNGTNGTNGTNAPPTAFTPVAIVEPCASNPNNPSVSDLDNPNLEMFLKFPNGMLLGTVSSDVQGDYTHLGIVAPNMTWESTGIGSNCLFSVDTNGTITKH